MQNTPLPDSNLPSQSALEQRALPQNSRERAIFVIARNLIPIIGVLFFGWSALNLTLLYFADTLAAMWALIAALLTQFFGGWTTLPWTTRFTNALYVFGLSLFLIAFMAIPLGMPIFILLMMHDWSWQEALRDQGFIFGLISIVTLSVVNMLRMALRFHHAPSDEKWSRNAFGLLFLRWVATLFVIFFLGGFVLPFAPILIVILYGALTVISELYPQRFLAIFGQSAQAATPPEKPPTAIQRARWERKRREHKK